MRGAELSDREIMSNLLSYWAAKRADRRFPSRVPSRADLDPIDFTYALGKVSIVEVIGAEPRFRYRLVSTRLTDHLGYEMGGKYVDEIPELETRAYVTSLYSRALAAAAPLQEGGKISLDSRTWQHETLVLPLASDHQRIDMLLIFRATTRPSGARLVA
jgi:hypothetical protein